jgi:hypothetical protein
MNNVNRPLSIVFGISAIVAAVCSAGCASNPQRQPMAALDLEYFQVDCRIREQQIRLLQSMRTNRDDAIVATVGNVFQPWQAWTDPNRYYQRHQVGINRINWLINQHLITIRDQC